MINTKKLLEMPRKWHKAAEFGRRRDISMRTKESKDSDKCSTSVATRGHIFVYSTDGNCFTIPLSYLTNNIFKELFRMSEEEFGLPRDGPITLPCDASYNEYIISLIPFGVSTDVESAVLTSIVSSRCSVSCLPPQRHSQQQLVLYGF